MLLRIKERGGGRREKSWIRDFYDDLLKVGVNRRLPLLFLPSLGWHARLEFLDVCTMKGTGQKPQQVAGR